MTTVAGTINLTGCNYQLQYDLLSQSVENNTSTIRLYGVLNVTNNQISWSRGTASVHTASTGIGTYYTRGSHTLITADFTFTHNSDGTLTIAPGYSLNTTFVSGSSTATITLPKIDRFAMMTGATSFNDESNPSFNYSNPRNLTLSAWLEVNPVGEHLATRTITNPGTSGTYTWELTSEEREQLRAKIPNSNSATCRIGIYSTIGSSTQASYKDRTFSIVNGNPTFSNFSVADVNPITQALTGSTTDDVININGYSNIQATITTNDIAEAIKSASMNKYRFKIGDSSVDIPYSSDSNVNGTINGATTGVYEVWAIDSRGNSTLATKQATSIINYDKVYIDKQSCSFVRDSNQVGENAILTLRGTFWNDNFGQVNNSLSISYRLKKTTSSTWITGTTTITPTISENDFTFIGQIASDNVDTTWDLEDNYNLEITVSDELSSITYDELVLNSAIPTMSLDKEGVGIMCAYDSVLGGKLQVDGKKVAFDGYELYNNTSGATGSIQLNDAVENYSYIEIFYKNNNNLYGYSKFYSPSEKNLTLSIMYPDSSSSQIWIQSTTKTITGKNLTNVNGRYAEAEVYNKSGFGRNDRIAIVRIVGYK